MSSSVALRSVRLLFAAVGIALLGVFALAAPAAAHVFAQPSAASVYTMSAGRLGATTAAVLGLIGMVVGGLALARPAGRFGTHNGRLGVGVALAAGLIAVALGGLVAGTSDGSLGTGNGLGGAIVALIVGLIAMALGGLALARSRHTVLSHNDPR
ncbi:DUF6223 family protein [Streptomyces sp. NPDC048484]|uniref:DUF6223 family protein n=1 Tax=Streptomyces sp. NPDC048484 TaxID=3155146 RepID=UPI0034230F45